MSAIVDPDITSPRFKADPYPFYARLRAEAPVFPVTLPGRQRAWLVSRYDDVAGVLKDERFAKDRMNALTPDQVKKQPWIPAVFKPLMRNMLDLDAPDHSRLRALVQKAFTPRMVEGLRGRVEGLAEELLDAIEGRGRIDLIGDFAAPLPVTVIAEMLGVPPEDRHRFRRWSNAISTANFSLLSRLKVIPHGIAFLGYIRKLVAARRKAPRDDMISALVAAEDAGDTLSEDETLAMIVLLLVAGHETTTHLISNGMLALLRHPEQLARLRGDPSLIDSAVEELLRFDGPLETATERFAREDVTIAGVTIPRGAMVFAVIASADRDESQFERPDELDLSRRPNRHLAFGQGVHYCLGAPLARMEGRIAIGSLLRRFSRIELAVAPTSLRWRGGIVFHGLRELPITLARP